MQKVLEHWEGSTALARSQQALGWNISSNDRPYLTLPSRNWRAPTPVEESKLSVRRLS